MSRTIKTISTTILALTLFALPLSARAERGRSGFGKAALVATAAVVAMTVPTAMWGTGTYNQLVTDRLQVQNNYSLVDTHLQSRNDTINNMVQIAKGYATHENKTFVGVAQARSGYMAAKTPSEKLAAANQVSVAVQPLLTLQEQYPKLQANEQFTALSQTLRDQNNTIAISRARYNDAVTAYNNKVGQFPSSIVAKIGTFQPAPLFQAEAAARTAPQINFGP